MLLTDRIWQLATSPSVDLALMRQLSCLTNTVSSPYSSWKKHIVVRISPEQCSSWITLLDSNILNPSPKLGRSKARPSTSKLERVTP
jgi:hypothetical protein